MIHLIDCYLKLIVYFICFNRYRSKDPKLNSEALRFKSGANQQFTMSEHIFDPSQYSESELQFDSEKEFLPVVIFCHAIEGDGK